MMAKTPIERNFILRLDQLVHDVETAPFTLKVRMLLSDVVEMLLYGCVTWTLGVEHFTVLHSAHRKLLL